MAQSRLGQDAILVPIGTTAERPSSPKAGEIRFNTDLSTFEGYDGSVWGGGGATVTVTGSHTVAAPPAYGTSVVNVDAATAAITIPENVPVGGRIHVRKINNTQGEVSIARSGTDTITRAALTEVTLNADGDNWFLEKVGGSRWELVAGVESGENSDGEYVRGATGIQVCWLTGSDAWADFPEFGTSPASRGVFDMFDIDIWTYPVSFADVPAVSHSFRSRSGGRLRTVVVHMNASSSNVAMRPIGDGDIDATNAYSIAATGRWYE